jgi:hypothetical protein
MKDQSARHATSAVVEYGLVRHTLVAALQNGSLTRDEICDAHPELMRAARNLGRATGENCPVCDDTSLVEVTYVFGSRLPAGGQCPTSRTELLKLERREDPVQCYAVEVCTSCHFHHLARKWAAGGRKAKVRQEQSS